MVSNNIVQYAESQNFVIMNSNLPDGTILRNHDGNRVIFLAILDNTRSHIWTSNQVLSLNSQLKAFHPSTGSYGDVNDVLIIIISGNTERDKHLAATPMANVWLVDAIYNNVLIYENQPSDFYGLYDGIASSVVESQNSNLRRKKANPIANFPFVTIILIAANIIYFIVLLAGGNVQDASYMLASGANYGPFIFEKLEVWRLLTSMFMHFSISHLVSNMIYLALAGYTLERTIGHLKFFIIYMLSGIGAAIVSASYNYIVGINTVSAGASGAIYGLIGVITFLTIKNMKHMRPSYVLYRIGIVIVFVFYSSFISSGIDGAAHIGGFIFGIILSFLLLNGTAGNSRKH